MQPLETIENASESDQLLQVAAVIYVAPTYLPTIEATQTCNPYGCGVLIDGMFEGVTNALGEKEDDKNDEEEDPEIAEARREAEEKRNEKYRKMEEEREAMRQTIRDKVSCALFMHAPQCIYFSHAMYHFFSFH